MCIETENKLLSILEKELNTADAAHDYWHAVRVCNNAKFIQQSEAGDLKIIVIASLVHDIVDAKLNNGNEKAGLIRCQDILNRLDLCNEDTVKILDIVQNISFKGGFGEKQDSIEFEIVQDADRPDAIGAVGIARTFAYGGAKNRLMYHPDMLPNKYDSAAEYRKNDNCTINHFHEKLLKLKDLMNTATGKKLAEERHRFMLQFLSQFDKEWNIVENDSKKR